MANFSIIKKLQLEAGLRLDAEYYQPEYLAIFDSIEKIGKKNLAEIAIIRSGTTPKDRDDDQKEGVVLLKTTDIRNNTLLSSDGYYFISKAINERMKNTRIHFRDVLINIVGATLGVIGRVAFVPNDFPDANITQAMALIRIKDELFLPEFIFTFIISKYGRSQADRLARPTGQYNINLKELGSLQIPVVNIVYQEVIKKLIEGSEEKSQASQMFYSEAERLLLNEFGIKDSKIDNEFFSVVNLSEVQNSHRIDAEYYQAKYQKVLALIRANRGMALGDLCSLKKGFEPGSDEYQEEGKLFIRVSSLSKQGIIDKDQKYLSDKLYQELKKDYQPKVGEILLTKDASPGVAYVVKEPVDGIISGGIVRLKLKEQYIDPEYLALCFNSVLGQAQAERDAGGSVIMHWKPEQIKNLQIPILPKLVQEKIADLVKQSHEARKKAKELLEAAKQKVEELIEKGQI